jgi:hypothetical protein
MRPYAILSVFAILFLTSCEKYGSYLGQTLGGSQSPMGEVGNTFSVGEVQGLSNPSAEITELNDGISTISFTCQVTDPVLLDMARYIPGNKVTGNTVTGGGKVKITDKGIMNVYEEGNLMLVKYDASVGDEYTLKRGVNTIHRKVTAKSETDDYFWGWMLIKTIAIEETGRGIPGVSKVEYQTNHKFGLVGVKVYFEDGTTKSVGVYSTN